MKEPDHDDLLKSVSRSFYLSLRFLPAAMREPASLGYLLARLSDTFADAPGLPAEERLAFLGDLRLVVLGDRERLGVEATALGEHLAHPGERVLVTRADELVDAFRSLAPELRELLAEVLLTILQGQAWDLRAFVEDPAACATGDDLLRYAYWVAGSVGEFWTRTAYAVLGERFADPDKTALMMTAGRGLGQALQLVNILRDLHEDLPRGRCYLPEDELRAEGWDGAGMPGPAVIAPVFRRWTGICTGLLEDSDVYFGNVRDLRMRFCSRLPRLLAGETVRLLVEAGAERVLSERIRTSRPAVWCSMARALFC